VWNIQFELNYFVEGAASSRSACAHGTMAIAAAAAAAAAGVPATSTQPASMLAVCDKQLRYSYALCHEPSSAETAAARHGAGPEMLPGWQQRAPQLTSHPTFAVQSWAFAAKSGHLRSPPLEAPPSSKLRNQSATFSSATMVQHTSKST
jgi:hypothetical protein